MRTVLKWRQPRAQVTSNKAKSLVAGRPTIATACQQIAVAYVLVDDVCGTWVKALNTTTGMAMGVVAAFRAHRDRYAKADRIAVTFERRPRR
jgi:hypothetical protein